MTTIGIPHDRSRPTALSDRGALSVRTTLLACGFLSSLVYVATDIVGGLSYPGYSFFSQAISELMAVGAPSERVVDPLFIIYGVLALLFAIGILREAAHTNRALRVTGVLLLGYAVFGMAGPTFFEMQQRGASTGHGDVPHIILTAVLVMLLLLAIGFGAFALGKRFRNYSLGTLLVVIAFGALAAPFGAKLAAGQPTPGFGIIERVNIYASLLWLAVLGVALLRRPMVRS